MIGRRGKNVSPLVELIDRLILLGICFLEHIVELGLSCSWAKGKKEGGMGTYLFCLFCFILIAWDGRLVGFLYFNIIMFGVVV